MNWITATDLGHWADGRDSQSDLPLLVRKLILSSLIQVGHLSLPAGDSIFRPGWDGLLFTENGSWPVPDGWSVWEFGTDKRVRQKANHDFRKRSQNPQSVDPRKTTFVFVTPRRWPDQPTTDNKWNWSRKKTRKGPWRKVVVLDAEDIETWLDCCPGIASWFARIIGKQPEGVESLDTFWHRIVSDTNPTLTSDVILAGRDQLCENLENWAEGNTPILRIKADTKEEAILLVAAWAIREQEAVAEFLFANALVVHTMEAWRHITSSNRPLILFPAFSNGPLGSGEVTQKGHWIVIPNGWDAENEEGLLIAPWLDRDQLKNALQKAGLGEYEAQQVTENSGRNLSVVMRMLATAPERQTPPWANFDEAQTLVPLLLAGRWNSAREGDREVIASLANRSYQEVEQNLSQLLFIPDSPVKKIGNIFLLTSPMDAWKQLGKKISSQTWERYKILLTYLLGQRDPKLDLLQDERWAGAIFGKDFKESMELRRGFVEQLARLVGLEERLKIDIYPPANAVAESLLKETLSSPDNIERWFSIKDLLADLAEAAPECFLHCLEILITKKDSVVQLFENSTGFFTTSLHVYIMFALEKLRWFPQFLSQCTEILIRLNAIDPGGNSNPRPRSTFSETFCLQEPENNIPFSDQLQLLQSMSKKMPTEIWPLLVDLLPHETIKTLKTGPKYREYQNTPDKPQTWGEFYQRIEDLLTLLFDLAGQQVERWTDIVCAFPDLHPNGRLKILHALQSTLPTLKQSPQGPTPLYHKLMELVRQHRAFSTANWALPPEEIDRLEVMARTIEPHDQVEIYHWLFHDQFPDLEFPRNTENGEKLRIEAIEKILEKGGRESLDRMAKSSPLPGLIGQALAQAQINEKEKREHFEYFLNQPEGFAIAIGRCMAAHFFNTASLPLKDFIAEYSARLPEEAFGRFAQGLPSGPDVWDAVEHRGSQAENAYWSGTGYYVGDKTENVGRAAYALLKHNRVADALMTIGVAKCPVPTTIIIDILERTPEVLAQLSNPLVISNFRYDVQWLFERLDENADISEKKLVELELQFFPFLITSTRGLRGIKTHLKNSPDFFVELLCFVYPKEEGNDEDMARGNLSSDQIQTLKHRLYKILHNFDGLPGLDNASPNATFKLKSWIQQALSGASAGNRKGIALGIIGEALARAPEIAQESWPPDHVCEVIEEFWSSELAEGFYRGAHNKLGARYVGEGEPDNELAIKYGQWADHRQLTHPRVSSLLRRISESFRRQSQTHKLEAELRRQI